jgi:hypothetical protein
MSSAAPQTIRRIAAWWRTGRRPVAALDFSFTARKDKGTAILDDGFIELT